MPRRRGCRSSCPCITRRPGCPSCTSAWAPSPKRFGGATASAARSFMSTTAAPMQRWRSRGALPPTGLLFMDVDGQHPPDLVEQLVGHWIDGGYDVVYTAKAHRDNEPVLRRLAVQGF